ncbi:hypothetical protein ABTZ93_17285 [Streptomyces sp. NPDC097941]|uniref:hypothetical protein n=1 Tax=Streptomyces sp. NPDC097941 TaxID=3155685 RepID=UPI003330A446
MRYDTTTVDAFSCSVWREVRSMLGSAGLLREAGARAGRAVSSTAAPRGRSRVSLRTGFSEVVAPRASPDSVPDICPAPLEPARLGVEVMMHGDDDGLRVPPRLAQTQVVVLATAARGLRSAPSPA